MSMSNLIFCVDGHRKCFNRRHVERIKLRKVSIGVLHSPHGRRECEIQNE